MQKCSYCGRETDDGLNNCRECGTRLTAGGAEVEAFQDSGVENPRRMLGEKLMRRGIIWLVGGFVVTLASYSEAASSPYGGRFFIAYGAIVFGIVQIIRGRKAASGTDTNEQADELLEFAAGLEGVDRARAMAVYAEVVRRFPGTRACIEAQRNMQTLASDGE